jgi:HEAT repeats
MKRFSLFWPIAATLLPLASGACSKKETPPETAASASASAAEPPLDIQFSFDVSAPDKVRATELATKVNSTTWEFEKDAWKAEDQKATLLLAATSSDSAAVGAALASLRTFTKPGAKANEDIALVAKRQLLSDDHHVAARALALIKPALTGSPDPELLKAVVTLGQTNAYQAGRERYEILRTLADVNVTDKNGAVKALVLSSLAAPEPPVVIAALKQLAGPRQRARSDAAIVEKTLPLLNHADAGVRGMAAAVLGQNGKNNSEVPKALTKALTDAAPYVRSQAATALAHLDYTPALHSLLPLTQDLAKNSHEYSFQSFEQRPDRHVLQGSYWPHVSAAALEAIVRLAPKEAKLYVDQVAPKDVEGSLKKHAKTYAAWYEKNKATIPAN